MLLAYKQFFSSSGLQDVSHYHERLATDALLSYFTAVCIWLSNAKKARNTEVYSIQNTLAFSLYDPTEPFYNNYVYSTLLLEKIV